MSLVVSNFNGQLIADHQKLSSFPLGMLQGIGLIETMLCYKGSIRFFEAHHKRLIAGLQTLGLNSELCTLNFLVTEINKTTAGINADYLRLRLQTGPDANGNTWWLLQAKPVDISTAPFQLMVAKSAIRSAQPLSALKSADRLCFYQAAQEAKAQNCTDALLLNQNGRVVESTIANLFWIKGAQLYTPALSEGCVAGIFRAQLMQGHEVIETQIYPEELMQADELFLTNALRGIIPVNKLQEHTFPTEKTGKLQKEAVLWW